MNKLESIGLAPVAICPYCGRYIKRGLARFVAHMEKCPSRKPLIFKYQVPTVGDFEWENTLKEIVQAKFVPRESGKFKVL